MPRIALCLEYDGTAFKGFQRQPASHGPTVQGVLERALSTIAAEPVSVACAGRTDAGVHATAQVVHFDCVRERPLRAWLRGTDAWTGPAVAVRAAFAVAPEFHARFSARSRSYCYLIDDRGARPVLSRGLVCPERPLDVPVMQEAAAALLGEHDFSAFRAAGCQSRTPVREIHEIDVRRSGTLVVIYVRANAFLLHMVRNIAGALIAIGRGGEPAQMASWLAGRDRRALPATAPPGGLYLVGVEYPPEFGLPAGPVWPPMLAAAAS